MRKSLYVVFDTVAQQAAGPVLLLPNDAVARRTFQDAILGEGSFLASHPQDYILLRIGSFDEARAIITPDDSEDRQVITGDMIMDLQRRQVGDPDQLTLSRVSE